VDRVVVKPHVHLTRLFGASAPRSWLRSLGAPSPKTGSLLERQEQPETPPENPSETPTFSQRFFAPLLLLPIG